MESSRSGTSINYDIISSDNGFSPVQRQAIIWSNIAY